MVWFAKPWTLDNRRKGSIPLTSANKPRIRKAAHPFIGWYCYDKTKEYMCVGYGNTPLEAHIDFNIRFKRFYENLHRQ